MSLTPHAFYFPRSLIIPWCNAFHDFTIRSRCQAELQQQASEQAREHHAAALDQEKQHHEALQTHRETHDKVLKDVQGKLEKHLSAGKKGAQQSQVHQLELEVVEMRAELKIAEERLKSVESELSQVR
jgi:hypothetical protein